MPAFLYPIIASFATGLAALLLRYIERKILKLDAVKTGVLIDAAIEAPTMAETNSKLFEARDTNTNLQKNLNGSFAKKIAIIAILITFTVPTKAAITTAIRVETNIYQTNDTADFTFYIWNDSADTIYTSSLLITVQGDWSKCDSGNNITAPVIMFTDTSLHPTHNPYVIINKGIFQFVFNLQSGNRLICPPGQTEVGFADLIIPNRTDTCNIQILYTTPNSPSSLSYAATQTGSSSFLTTWYKFFITSP